MFCKTITYSDYNGDSRTEKFFFNLTQAEALEMEASVDGGLSAKLKTMMKDAKDRELIKMFKYFIEKSYGEKSEDGRHFIKIDANGHRLADDFLQTEAYSAMFMELVSDVDFASEFINGVMPKMDKTAVVNTAISEVTK